MSKQQILYNLVPPPPKKKKKVIIKGLLKFITDNNKVLIR